MSSDKLNQAFKKTGDRERFCLETLTHRMNSNSTNLIYEFTPTSSGRSICYDGTLTVRDKATLAIKSYHLIEAKVRTEDWDDLILEADKLKYLRKEKAKQDMSSQIPTGILYINFTPLHTYIFDLNKLVKERMLPNPIMKSMNRMTIASTSKKVNKQVYLLNTSLANRYSAVELKKQ